MDLPQSGFSFGLPEAGVMADIMFSASATMGSLSLLVTPQEPRPGV